MDCFFTWHIILGVGKSQDLPNKIWQTLGDALRKQFLGFLFSFFINYVTMLTFCLRGKSFNEDKNHHQCTIGTVLVGAAATRSWRVVQFAFFRTSCDQILECLFSIWYILWSIFGAQLDRAQFCLYLLLSPCFVSSHLKFTPYLIKYLNTYM